MNFLPAPKDVPCPYCDNGVMRIEFASGTVWEGECSECDGTGIGGTLNVGCLLALGGCLLFWIALAVVLVSVLHDHSWPS